MSQPEDLDQQLDLARLGLSSTSAARVRVRSELAARGAFSQAGSLDIPRQRVPTLVSAALVGLSFAAGYWLRDVQLDEARGALPSVVEPTASPVPPSSLPTSSRLEPSPAPSSLPSALPGAVEPSARVEPPPAHPVSSRQPIGEPSAAERRPAPRQRTPPSGKTAGNTAAGSLRATSGELALLRRAERAIRSGDPALALILLDQLERAYPRSTLGEERAAARILVECARSGGLAKPEAARFLEQHPSSVYSDRIVRACQLEGAGPAESPADVRSNGH